MTKRRSKAVRASAAAPTQAAVSPVQPVYEPGTLGEWLDYIMPNASDGDWVPMWPPDAFAIGAALLRRTGGYLDLVNGDDLRHSIPVLTHETVRKSGQAWRRQLNEVFSTDSSKKRKRIREVCPAEIREAWQLLRNNGHVELSDVRDKKALTAAAVTLCTVSDAASEGLGVGLDPSSTFYEAEKDGKATFLAFASRNAKDPNRFRSYCLHIPPSKLAVLGKRHTPQRGCSIRSLSHHLALYTPTEIQAVWPEPIQKIHEEIDVFNVLLLPWPTAVADADFMTLKRDNGQRYFDYKPVTLTKPTAVERVKHAMTQARTFVDRVHAVVLPEMALDEAEFAAIEKFVASQQALVVSGVRKAPCSETCDMPANTCVIQPYGLSVHADSKRPPKPEVLDEYRRKQSKHHRWCLDRRQIMQYRLGGRLPASRDCWEFTYLGQREIYLSATLRRMSCHGR